MLVVGAGGLGAAALLVLARHGVGTFGPGALGVADGDPVELSNLHRQLLHRMDDLGHLKTESTARFLREAAPAVRVELHPFRLGKAELPRLACRYDVLLDATDDPEMKFLLNDVAVEVRRPLVHAGAIGLRAQILTILPGRSACLRCLFPEPPTGTDALSCREGGVLGPLPAFIGALQAEQALRLLDGKGGRLAGRFLSLDLATSRQQEIDLRPDPECPVCAAPRPQPEEMS